MEPRFGGRGGYAGGGRGRGRERSYSPPRQRGSPVYDNFPPSRGRGHGPPPRGRRDDFDYRDERGPPRGGDRFDGPRRRGPYDRAPSYERGYGGPPMDRGGPDRDRDGGYSDGGPPDYGPRGAPGGPYGRRGPDSPGYDLDGPGGSGEFGGRRNSRNLSPDDSLGGPPLSKIMFIKRMIDEDLPEKEIDRRYTDYLAAKFKSKNKAEFERQKNDDAFKRRFDPFIFKEEVESRARTAQTTAVAFGKDMQEGKYDWKTEGRQQLLLPSEYHKAVQAKSAAPVISWHPKIISSCWKIGCRLVVKMDEEKNVRRDFMEWIAPEVAKDTETRDEDGPNADTQDEEKAQNRETDKPGSPVSHENSEQQENGADTAMADAEDAPDEKEAKGDKEGAQAATGGGQGKEAYLLEGADLGDDLAAKTGQLDVMLEYLWQVHGVDFYSGADGELTVEVYKSVKERLKRTSPDVEFRCMRTNKPKSGALVDERKREQVMEEFHHIVTKPWIERLKRVDPDTQKAFDLDRQLESAVDIAVQNMIENSMSVDKNQTSYRCQFCAKKFKGEDYLRKHINNKHEEEMSDFKEAERNKAREDLFFESFETHAAQEEEAANAEAADGGNAMGGMMPGMNGAGMMGPMAFMPMQMQMMNMLMASGMANPMGMGRPMGVGGMGGANPMMMEQMMGGRGAFTGRGGGGGGGMMAGRGGNGGRGGGRGGRGGRGGPPQYYDFDSVANQRDQLNYGDI